MPAISDPKPKLHPWMTGRPRSFRESASSSVDWSSRSTLGETPAPPKPLHPRLRLSHVPYAELSATSNFSFLRGASHPDELMRTAADLGLEAMALTDTNTLAGIVRAHVAANDVGIPFIVGSRLLLNSPAGYSMLVYPTNRAAYGRLCRLLTLGKSRVGKGECDLSVHDVMEHSEGLLAVLEPPKVVDDSYVEFCNGLRSVFDGDRLSLAASCTFRGSDDLRLHQLQALSDHVHMPMVAVNQVRYHVAERNRLQDVLTCIREGCTLESAGFHLAANAERYLKTANAMGKLFASYPHALSRTIEIAERAKGFNLEQLQYDYPDETVPAGSTPMQHLAELTWAGARGRYPSGIPAHVRQQIEYEYKLIDELRYAPYFLTVHDLVRFARSQGILCQGRGAAANSAVCYCLGVTSVDPEHINILFERFVSKERNEPPDIDIDFEHERREEVIQYVYGKYGRDRAALTGVVISYRGRMAIREVGKALGLSLDCVDRLAKNIDWWDSNLTHDDRAARLREHGLNPDDPTMLHLTAHVRDIIGFPRHLSQHVGGFVITKSPLNEMVPIENAAMPDRTVIEWDKDDIDALNILKVDVLGLGMLSCIRKCFSLVEQHHDHSVTLATVPQDDPHVYDMICEADTVGVFQIESRAQMTMLPRLKPRHYYDLVIEVAIVRPGPIQGDMVHPYLRRRNGEEPITYPNKAIEKVLGRTLGIPLFQEQVMEMAIVAAGFTPGEADQLRRAIAAWKNRGKSHIMNLERRIVGGMMKQGYAEEFARRYFEQIKGFGDYGFPESHAASFALLVYVSCWLKHYYPAAFATALINSQPMGFYAPAQIVRDAQSHGVEVRQIDVNHSHWNCTLEQCPSSHAGVAMRLGMRLIKGLKEVDATALHQAVQRHGVCHSMARLKRISGLSVAALTRLAHSDAFRSMRLDRQQALWELQALQDEHLPLFDESLNATVNEQADTPADYLPEIGELRKVVHDYESAGVTLRAHPISFIRGTLDDRRVTPAYDLTDESLWPHGKIISVAGLVLVRQRPSTASGVVFMTLEDETGVTNIIVRPHIFERDRKATRHSTTVLVQGQVERQGQVVHVMAQRILDISHELQQVAMKSRDFR